MRLVTTDKLKFGQKFKFRRDIELYFLGLLEGGQNKGLLFCKKRNNYGNSRTVKGHIEEFNYKETQENIEKYEKFIKDNKMEYFSTYSVWGSETVFVYSLANNKINQVIYKDEIADQDEEWLYLK